MTKTTFIDTLRELLQSLNEDECNKFISYYEEIIEDLFKPGDFKIQVKKGETRELNLFICSGLNKYS